MIHLLLRRCGRPRPPAVEENKRRGFFACAQNDKLIYKYNLSLRGEAVAIRNARIRLWWGKTDSSLALRMTGWLQNKPFSERHLRPFPTQARKIAIFRGMSWAPSPTSVDVGEPPIRHINVKHRHSACTIYRNHETISVIVRRGGALSPPALDDLLYRGGRPRPPVVGKNGFFACAQNDKLIYKFNLSLRGEAVAIRNAHICPWCRVARWGLNNPSVRVLPCHLPLHKGGTEHGGMVSFFAGCRCAIPYKF